MSPHPPVPLLPQEEKGETGRLDARNWRRNAVAVGLKPSAKQGEARLRGLTLTIGVNPFSRVDFSGEMSDLLYPVRLPPLPPAPLLPHGEKGETGRCTPLPPNPLLPHGEKGEAGHPDARNER